MGMEMPKHALPRIGIENYSYHRYFGETTKWEKPLSIRWSIDQFLQRSKELSVQVVSLQTVYVQPLNHSEMDRLRAELDSLGLAGILAWGHPSGLAGGTKPREHQSILDALPLAKALGSSILRIVCGDPLSWSVPASERIDRLVPILADVAQQADDVGLTLVIENHNDFTIRELVRLIDLTGGDNLGICFDTGNAVRVGDDVVAAAQLAAQLIAMVHIKDLVVLDESRGDPAGYWPSAPLGEGDVDIKGFLDVLIRVQYEGGLFIEMNTMHPTWPDEDAAVAKSVAFLERYLEAPLPGRTTGSPQSPR